MAVGGTKLYQDFWASNGTGTTNAIARANVAMAISGNRFSGILFHQGESDSGISGAATSGPNYQSALSATIDALRGGITGAAAAPFVCGQMVPEYIDAQGATAVAIDAVHSSIATWKDRRCAYWTGASGKTPDNLHYNAAGQRINGVSAFNAYVRAASHKLLWAS